MVSLFVFILFMEPATVDVIERIMVTHTTCITAILIAEVRGSNRIVYPCNVGSTIMLHFYRPKNIIRRQSCLEVNHTAVVTHDIRTAGSGIETTFFINIIYCSILHIQYAIDNQFGIIQTGFGVLGTTVLMAGEVIERAEIVVMHILAPLVYIV